MFFSPLARYLSTLSSPSFMPSKTAALCASERSLKLKVLPGPTPILASLARMSWDSGSGGTYSRAASRYSKKFALIPAVVAGGEKIFWAGGGGGRCGEGGRGGGSF